MSAVSVTDPFTGTTALSANWTSTLGTASCVSGEAKASSAPAIYYWNANTFSRDVMVSCTIGTLNTKISLNFRFSGFVGYSLGIAAGGTVTIEDTIGATLETITSVTQNAGDTFSVVMSGKQIRAYRNGVALGTGVRNTTYASAGTCGWALSATADTIGDWSARDYINPADVSWCDA